MKTQLEVGDRVKRFEISRGEIDCTHVVDRVTKKYAFIREYCFSRNLDFTYTNPDENRFLCMLTQESKSGYRTETSLHGLLLSSLQDVCILLPQVVFPEDTQRTD